MGRHISRSYADARKRVEEDFRRRYGVEFDDLVITSIPGHWVDRLPKVHCVVPLTGEPYDARPFRALYRYDDPRRDSRGRFQNRALTWGILRCKA